MNSEALDILHRLKGYYECPKDAEGFRYGPLVGYAGTYTDQATGGNQRHWVGEQYFNFAKAEEFGWATDWFANALSQRLGRIVQGAGRVNHVIAAPLGGIVLGARLAAVLHVRFGFAEKKVIEPATEVSRGKSVLVLDRHTVEPDSNVVLQEDVTNNFSTTEELVRLVESAGAKVIAIATAFNRAETEVWRGLPVISVEHLPTRQYRQDDPFVSYAIKVNNVVWDPKRHWHLLQEAMESYRR